MKLIQFDITDLDLSNYENIKQHIINAFQKHELTIQKFRRAKDGVFVYHNRGMSFKRKVRTLVEETDNKRLYSVHYKKYGVSFVSTLDKDVFADSLILTIIEALRRNPIS